MKPNAIRTNNQIFSKSIILIDEDGTKLGSFDNQSAVKLATDKGFDLIELSFDKNKNESVCKIADFGKYMYEKKKREKQQDKIQRENAIQLKEIQLRPTTDVNDLKIKAKKAVEFLEAGDRVKIVMRLHHREITHKDVGYATMNEFLTNIDSASIEKSPYSEGHYLVAFLFTGQK